MLTLDDDDDDDDDLFPAMSKMLLAVGKTACSVCRRSLFLQTALSCF